MAEPGRPVITIRRRGSCVTEQLNPGRSRAVAECCHGRIWSEGALYGLGLFEACQPCVEGACPNAPHG